MKENKNNFCIFNCSQVNAEDFSVDLPVSASEKERFIGILKNIADSAEPVVIYDNFFIMGDDGEYASVNTGFICTSPGGEITVTFNRNDEEKLSCNTNDPLTGLYTRSEFTKKLELKMKSFNSGKTELAVVYFDIQRFKAVNDMFGMATGDSLLLHMASAVNKNLSSDGAGCRIGSDRFVFFTECETGAADDFIQSFIDEISDFDLPFEIICNAGVYIADDKSLSAAAVIDRAIMAQSVIKGSYTERYNYYNEDLRKSLISEQEITGLMGSALKEAQFLIYYQPQYNHSTGMLVGAEALVRWLHPEKGLISPGVFIPIFEKNGFITKLDLYVFEKVCVFLRKCIDKKLHIVPISINLTRYDVFSPNFIEKLEAARKKYDIPSKYIRVEITESAALGNSRFINEAVEKLHGYGYIVEMDDFGSGYSSLNILKDINFDVIKLDMRFLESEQGSGGKGGTILSSVVRMVNWLSLPVIAEGVETVKQADFLRSIGCDYIQGYLYSHPLPENEYESLIAGSTVGSAIPQLNLIETLNAGNFWSNDSLETLIFSNFVGGAAIFDYSDGKIEVLRVNKKYLSELGMNLSEKEVIASSPLNYLNEADKETYLKMLEAAIETGDEQECETWRRISSDCCGEETFCIRTSVRMIGKSKENFLFYAMIRNITAEKRFLDDFRDSERRFKMASEQVNIYYWEYTVATREMRPCFRCMRDLGLPALLTNYPDSAIEMGVFPPEIADTYRDWHRQIAEGVPYLEAVMPLTVGRIPFNVRYTTEFDENGHPVKAYGSAALVVNVPENQTEGK